MRPNTDDQDVSELEKWLATPVSLLSGGIAGSPSTVWADRKADRRLQSDNYISVPQFDRLYSAVAFSNHLVGKPMNVRLTITLANIALVDHESNRRGFTVWLARLRDWHLHRGVATHWIYVWERPKDASLHVHLLLRVPDHDLRSLKNWCARSFDNLGTVSAPCHHIDARQDETIARQWYWFRYLMKGLNPNIRDVRAERSCAEQAGIVTVQQGAIAFPRVGMSRSLSRGSQQKAGFGRLLPWNHIINLEPSDYWTNFYLTNSPSAPKTLF